ncbi:MAG: ATP-binding protein, partial [Elainellaceae cyanobacterium]
QRMESGTVTMAFQVCDAAELIVKATEAMRAMAQHYDVQLLAQPVSLLVWADPDYIVQTLTNLLSNAIKFSPSNTTVTVKTQCFEEESRPNIQGQDRCPIQETCQTAMATFQVQDQGLGISKDKLESIFERFQQVDPSDARKKGGTGLGLAICRKIIEQHDGEIWVESGEGEGSTFIFTLPLSSAIPKPAHDL